MEKRTCTCQKQMSSKQYQLAKSKHGNAFKAPKKSTKTKKVYPQKALVMASPERKNYDVLTTMTLPPSSKFTISSLLCAPAASTGGSGRIGRKVRMVSHQFRYNFLKPSDDGPSQVRIVIVYDRQPDGLTPTPTQVFNDDAFVSPLSLPNAERFEIIMDEVSESRQSTALNISGSRYRKMNHDVLWSGTNGDVSALKTGGLWCFAAMNDTFQVNTNTAPLEVFFRTRFIDV